MPTKKHTAVLINPSSAGGLSLKKWPAHRDALHQKGVRTSEYVSASEADFREHTRMLAKKFKRIAVVGGDSSLTIAGEELVAANYKGVLQFLPAGSVNDIILDLRENTAQNQSAYLGFLKTQSIQKNFIGQANFGIGVFVNRWVGKILHTLPFLRPLQNTVGVLCILVGHLFRRDVVSLSLGTKHKTYRGRYSLVLVSQIRHWAGGLLFAPEASYFKKAFQIVAVRRTPLLRFIKIIQAAKDGGHLHFNEVETFFAPELTIEAQKNIAVQIDGDILCVDGKIVKSQKFILGKKKSALRLTG